jgi:hypothetical protein
MAQFDLLILQNISAGIEFTERFVNLGAGGLLTKNTSNEPIALPKGSTGQFLKATVNGINWETVDLTNLHAQNTDVGTSSSTFYIGTGGPKVKNAAGAIEIRNNADNAYANFRAANSTFDYVTLNNEPNVDSHAATKLYVDGAIGRWLATNDAMIFKGYLDCSTNPNYPAADAGHTYRVSVAGKIGGASGPNVEAGDMLTCSIDGTASGTHATVGANWGIYQTNIDGAVTGPASSVDNQIALFSGTTGKIIKSGSVVGSMAYETATNYILKSTLNAAHTVMKADAANTPTALAVAADGIVGRLSTGNIASLTPTNVRSIINVADGATANAKATGAEINTGSDDVKFATPKAIADSTIVKGPASSVADRIALFDGTTGKLLKDGGLTLASLMRTWVTAPANKTATGTAGQIAYDTVTGNYLYVCTANNIWKRVSLATNW